jgi:hypothetical protein
MNDKMPPTLKVEAPTIKVENDCKPLAEVPFAMPSIKLEEGKIAEGSLSVASQLVAYSSSPPPLIEGHPALSKSNGNDISLNILPSMRGKYCKWFMSAPAKAIQTSSICHRTSTSPSRNVTAHC